jgi:hypothetical protein
MKQSSLEKAVDIIIEALDKSDIDKIDKTELMINIPYFLDAKRYRENVKVLQKKMSKRKY